MMETNFRSLGESGINVSPFGFGAMLLGTVIDEEHSYKLLDEYVNQGGNFIDTANCYCYWVEDGDSDASEQLLGRWIKSRENRDKIVLATKCGARPKGDSKSHLVEDMEGLAPEVMTKALERSLENLQQDYVDVFYVHIDDRRIDLFQIMQTLDGFVKSGKVRSIGCSNFSSWRLQEAQLIAEYNGFTKFSIIQQHLTYLNPRMRSDFGVCAPVSSELEDLLGHRNDVALVTYSPLLSGYYTRPERRDSYWRKHVYENTGNESRLEALGHIAEKYGTNENVIVLAWLTQRNVTSIPLIAASKLEQIRENFEALTVRLTVEDMEYLEQA